MEIKKVYKSKVERETLYYAWVSEETLVPPAVKIESNPVVGGIYKLHASAPPEVFIAVGKFKEVIEGKRLVYSWQWEGTPETTEIVVTFSEDEDHTILELTHSGFDSEDSRQNHDNGWDSYFKGLEAILLDQ